MGSTRERNAKVSLALLTPDELARRLAQRKRATSAPRGRAAAVLLPLFERDGETFLLFIKRTETLRTHKGQYAFPGGARDEADETLTDTALREAHEEIGLPGSTVRVLGWLDDMATPSGFVITPVVGWLASPPRDLVLNAAEVAYTVELPLRSFVSPPRARTLLREGLRLLALGYDIDGHFIWGATARILRTLVAVVKEP